jgi:hypothetical protein
MRMKKTKTKKPSKPLEMMLDVYKLSSSPKDKMGVVKNSTKGRPKK